MKEKDMVSRRSKDLQMQKEKRYEKMFISIKTDATLEGFLSTLTKSDLDEIRLNFELSGISSLKKAELIDVLNVKIRDNLSFLTNKLTDREYKLILKTIKNAGVYTKDDDYRDTFIYLRKYGIMYGAIDNNCKFFAIPKDLQAPLKESFNKLEVINKIKINEKISKIATGLLFYYGILKASQFIDMINSFLKDKIDSLTFLNLISEYNKKGQNINLQDNYYYHTKVKDYKYMVSEIEKRPLLNYCPLNVNSLLQADDIDFTDWNNSDKSLYNYLLNSFNLSEARAVEHIRTIKSNFKNGTSFSDAMKQFSEKFNIRNFPMAQEIGELLQGVYSNTKQWILKGYSPEEVYALEKTKLSSTTENRQALTQSKIGRNDSCPCGSGKKYKSCCLKNL